MALGIQPAWEVKEATFSTNKIARSELHLRIGFSQDLTPLTLSIYDT